MMPKVECHAGYSGCDYPTALVWEGQRLEISAVLAEWREPQAKCYRVQTDDTSQFALRFEDNEWQIKPL